MVSLACGISPCSILMRSGGVSATTAVARLLTSGEDVSLWLLGDSRTAARGNDTYEEAMIQGGAGITWGGAALRLQAIGRAGETGILSPGVITGDSRIALTGALAGHYADEYFPGEYGRFVEPVAGVTSTVRWFGYSITRYTRALLPLLFDRASTLGSVDARSIVPCTGALTPQPNLRAAWAINAVTGGGQTFGSAASPSEGGTALPEVTYSGIDYATTTERCPTITYLDGQTLIAGDTCFSNAFVKACPGVTMCSLSVPGRSVAGWADNDILSATQIQSYIAPVSSALGGTPVLWIDIGQNKKYDFTRAQHADYLRSIISKWRANVSGAKYVMLTTSYKASDDAIGVLTDYALAMYDVAASDTNVALYDTMTAMGEYSTYSADMADGIHLSTSGRITRLAPTTASLITAAA